MITPSMINGAQIKKSDAPISRIMAISGLRTTIPVEMVEWIKKTDTSTRIRISTAEPAPTILLAPDKVPATSADRFTSRTPAMDSI